MEVFGTAFLPNIAYLKRLFASSNPYIDLGEHFVKQTQRNRTVILSSNGVMPIIIPLRKKDSLTLPNAPRRVLDMEISYAEDWQTKSLRAIRSSYKNSPYYEHYQEEFEHLLMSREPLLYQYNMKLMGWLLKQLDVSISLTYSELYIDSGVEKDYRSLDFYAESKEIQWGPYKQVFSHKMNFISNLTVIDLLFNKGPEALPFLQ
jgi:WbqC-like protein family